MLGLIKRLIGIAFFAVVIVFGVFIYTSNKEVIEFVKEGFKNIETTFKSEALAKEFILQSMQLIVAAIILIVLAIRTLVFFIGIGNKDKIEGRVHGAATTMALYFVLIMLIVSIVNVWFRMGSNAEANKEVVDYYMGVKTFYMPFVFVLISSVLAIIGAIMKKHYLVKNIFFAAAGVVLLIMNIVYFQPGKDTYDYIGFELDNTLFILSIVGIVLSMIPGFIPNKGLRREDKSDADSSSGSLSDKFQK